MWYCVVDGQQHGPIDWATLVAWAREGRLRPQDLVWTEGMAQWVPASSYPELFCLPPLAGTAGGTSPLPPSTGAPFAPLGMVMGANGMPLKPHRGTMVFGFGLAGLVGGLCCIVFLVFGILAWVMGSGDLKQMNMGLMDPAGRGMTKAGIALGIIGICLAIIGLIVVLCFNVGGGFGPTGRPHR